MQLEDYLEFVSPDEIRIKGHRIGLEDVLKYYLAGYSPEQILEELPSLNLEKIHAVIIYYLHDRVAVDAYLLRVSEWREHRYQEWNDSELRPAVQRLRALKAQRRENSLNLT